MTVNRQTKDTDISFAATERRDHLREISRLGQEMERNAATSGMTEIPVPLAHAFRDLVAAAKGIRHARRTYMGVADSEGYYERLFAALDAVEEARHGRT